MKLSRQAKIILGILTAAPAAYIVLFMAMFMATFFSMFGSGGHPGPPAFMLVIFPLHMLAMLLIMGLIVFYVVYVVKCRHIKEDMRPIWIIVVVVGSVIGMAVVWYLLVWKEPEDEPGDRPPGSGF